MMKMVKLLNFILAEFLRIKFHQVLKLLEKLQKNKNKNYEKDES